MTRSKTIRPADPESARNPSDSTFEDAMAEVERLVEQIESGDIGLEASLAKYERGAALVKHCRDLLARAEQRITDLDRQMEADGDAASHTKAGRLAESDADADAD